MKTEEMDCGGFFDNIDDFLDVPNDDDDVVASSSLPPIDQLDSFPGIWSDVMTGDMQESSFPCSDSFFSNSDISAELFVPYEDIVQLEWLSSFVEDSFSAGDGSGSSSSLTVNMPVKDSPEKQGFNHRFRTSSPVSVLDSSSSCSTEKTSNTIAPSRCSRARTKRPRPTTANSCPITTSPLPLALVSPASVNTVESRLMNEIPNHNKKKKKIKFTLPAAPAPCVRDGDLTLHPIRKCQHCEITETPQWRAGPMGPKTLCNACGVRYKSGRLFPEYRPSASPTFVPTVHSNSHKKVLEMRNKTGSRAMNGGGSAAIELIPNLRRTMFETYRVF